jgi:hypothetical protein
MQTPSSAANNTLLHELQERVKKLDCICAISDVAANPNATFESCNAKQ